MTSTLDVPKQFEHMEITQEVGNWLAAFYHISVIVVFINLLIAMMSRSFEKTVVSVRVILVQITCKIKKQTKKRKVGQTTFHPNIHPSTLFQTDPMYIVVKPNQAKSNQILQNQNKPLENNPKEALAVLEVTVALEVYSFRQIKKAASEQLHPHSGFGLHWGCFAACSVCQLSTLWLSAKRSRRRPKPE